MVHGEAVPAPSSPASPLLLGSASPRRREILTSLGIAHVVRPADADESEIAGESPEGYQARVCLAKLTAVRASLPPAEREGDAVVLVADTIVLHEGAILGKPADEAEARATIARLAGRTHEVRTRFLLAPASRARAATLHEETVVTRVTFRSLDDDEVRAYAASGEGLDKAGGYAVQGRGAALVSRIEGSYSNVVGLPACELVVALRRLGVS